MLQLLVTVIPVFKTVTAGGRFLFDFFYLILFFIYLFIYFCSTQQAYPGEKRIHDPGFKFTKMLSVQDPVTWLIIGWSDQNDY